MTSTKHLAYTASIASLLTTELNSLANNTKSSASSAVDNTSNKDLWIDLNLSIATTSSRTAGGGVAVYMVQALDGTNYPTVNETCDRLVAYWTLDAATTARPELIEWNIPIPPGLVKFYILNQMGVSFAASGSLLEFRAHSIESA